VAEIGPIAVGVDAMPITYTQYKSEIYKDPTCGSNGLNHAMLLVGYGTENGEDYWLLKNR